MTRAWMAGGCWRAAVLALTLGAVAALPSVAQAKTLRWASDQDLYSLDPYARQETFLLSFVSNIYEPLVRRDRNLQLEPALALRWHTEEPTRWRFELRHDVRFQGGEAFTADDVVFSFARLRKSNLANALASIAQVVKVDDFTVDILTNEPDPILPEEIAVWDIMSARWTIENDAVDSANTQPTDDNYAAFHADGTGPFMVAERKPDSETVLVPNPQWWDKPQHDLDRIVFRPMPGVAAVNALLAGTLDVLSTVPTQSADRIARSSVAHLVQGPELRTIFLGFNLARDELPDSDVKGRNPFRDPRVRQAFAQAIDEDTIKTKVMRGFARPAGLLVGPGINGYDAALDTRLAFDPGTAKSLLAEAGYPNGFSLGIDCPNDRYVNDEAICDAVVAMLAKVGVKVKLDAETRGKVFGKLLMPDYRSSFFLLGWASPTYDALNPLINLAAARNRDAHRGDANFTGYANPALDDLITRIGEEFAAPARVELLHQALAMVHDDLPYLPLHQQQLVWAARNNVDLVQRADGTFPLRYVTVK